MLPSCFQLHILHPQLLIGLAIWPVRATPRCIYKQMYIYIYVHVLSLKSEIKSIGKSKHDGITKTSSKL